jgi:hypothetical protein
MMTDPHGNSSASLAREDIVGKRIRAIYQSAWLTEADGCGSRQTIIELDDGTAFELQS